MRGPEVRVAGGKLSIEGVELPGRCADFTVSDDMVSPFVRVEITLLVERKSARVEHYCDPSRSARKTPSGKNACQVCGEAWPCTTESRRRLDSSSGAPLD